MGPYKPLRTWVDFPIPYGNNGSFDPSNPDTKAQLQGLELVRIAFSAIVLVFFLSREKTRSPKELATKKRWEKKMSLGNLAKKKGGKHGERNVT